MTGAAMFFRFVSALLLIWISVLGLPLAASAQPGQGASGPAAAEINRTFSFGSKWAMYGAPQATRLDEAGFNQLVARVGQTDFAAQHVQIVVIMRGADATGTIGLIEKRKKKVESLFLKSGGENVYEVWHKVGFRTSPDRISADFRENILAAEEAYKDLPVVFSGTVRGVTKDEQGDIYVEFVIKGRDAGLICYPWQGAPQGLELRELKAGHKVQASAQFTGYGDNGAVKMRGCLFTRN